MITDCERSSSSVPTARSVLHVSDLPKALPDLQGPVVAIEDAARRKAYREAFRAMMKAMSALIDFDPQKFPCEMGELANDLLSPYLDPEWHHSREFTMALLKECATYLVYVEDVTPGEIVNMLNEEP